PGEPSLPCCRSSPCVFDIAGGGLTLGRSGRRHGGDLSQQPLQSGQMLLIVAAEVVSEPAQGDAAVPGEVRRAQPLLGPYRREELDGSRPRLPEGCERLGAVPVPVVTLARERVRVE